MREKKKLKFDSKMIHVFYARGEGISEAKTTAKGLAGSFSRSWIAGVVSHWQGLLPKSSRRDQKTMLNIIGRNIVCYGNSRQIARRNPVQIDLKSHLVLCKYTQPKSQSCIPQRWGVLSADANNMKVKDR